MSESRLVSALVPDADGAGRLDPLPDGVQVTVWDCAGEPPEGIGDVEFWVPPFVGRTVDPDVLEQMPALRVIQLLSAGADAWIPLAPDGVSLCDARGVHTSSTAEWVATAILASVREFDHFARMQPQRRWDRRRTSELAGSRVLVLGAGAVGEGLCARLEPFDVDLVRVARTARDGVHGIGELPELLPAADVVVLLVPLTPATTGLVDAAFLARMHDGALLVNAARGPVVDTEALLAELTAGRLRAAVDVTDPEPLPADHPLWEAPGLLLTPHVGGNVPGMPRRAYALVGEQLGRFVRGEELHNVVSDGY